MVSDWVERSFFSLTVFGGNLLAGDVNWSMTMDRHVQAWQWIGSISLLTWGLFWASACSLESWDDTLVFLLLLLLHLYVTSIYCSLWILVTGVNNRIAQNASFVMVTKSCFVWGLTDINLMRQICKVITSIVMRNNMLVKFLLKSPAKIFTIKVPPNSTKTWQNFCFFIFVFFNFFPWQYPLLRKHDFENIKCV